MYRVAIVGRPNVGKSTLFNRLTRTRKAIVGDEPGITRDRLIEVAEWDDRQFEVIDTGGIIPDEKELIPEKILEQASIALEDSSLILLVVDARAGVTPLDQSLNSLIRSTGKDYLLVANKSETPRVRDEALQFHSLGVAEIMPVSAEHNLGIQEITDRIVHGIPDEMEPEEERPEIRVAIIGRPNVGKSSLLNRFVGKERVIVTEIAGTTRDSVDTAMEVGGQRFRIVDTAGIRRKSKTSHMAEKLSVVMARKSILRSDVVLLVVDPLEGPSHLDATIGSYAHQAGRSVVVVVNKWDLVDRDTYTTVKVEEDFRDKLRFLDHAPMIFVSALSGQRVVKILDRVKEAHQARYIRVPTAELNQFLARVVRPHLLSSRKNRRFPALYMTQVGVAPPTFVLFLRSSKKLPESTVRFFVNQLRKEYLFYASPIRILQRTRK